ncbi:hypothetical protein [Domibacillus sp. PGB-M46]|nr:hypothetical protein [Domibacillus sp. PGB-M46]
MKIEVPKNKDWNDDLKEVGSLEKQKQNQITALFSNNQELEYKK